MFAMLLRRLAIAGLICAAILGTLDRFDPAPPPLLVHAKAPAAEEPSFPEILELAMKPEKPQLAYPSPYLADASTVAQVICTDMSSGSAFYIGSGDYVTAAHVMLSENTGKALKCFIAGQRTSIKLIDVHLDYAIIHAEHYPPFRVSISCDRLAGDQTYFATGFADGNPWPVTSRIRGTGIREVDETNGITADVNGAIVAGMSGGSVADFEGVVHAIVESRDSDGVPDGGVVELADTPLCKKGKK